ncbi:hypothetical protein LG311_17840 [Sutcliffiella horikoshii]|uniref:hypothetical protein n=1 Tax=Sutcliffiella horikoshii TaxID=79883 RepID=UPI0038517945
METVKQNLQYIKASIETGTHHQQKAIVHLMLEDTVLSVKEQVFKYDLPQVTVKEDYHVPIFVARSRKAKACVLSDLHELQVYISKGIHEKRCVAIINKLLTTNFYQNEIHRTIGKWVNVSGKKFEVNIKKLNVK